MVVNEAGLWDKCFRHLLHEKHLWLMNRKHRNDFRLVARISAAVDKVSAGL
jgi:hypothetical protein